jgi:2-oxoglutarate ferredoxin oxidoreductase subunit gamma
MSRTEIRFAGEGGQGLILAAIILAEAAARSGFSVAQSQQYGPESRGGHTWADVIVADEEVDYPQATNLDVLVALSGKGLARSLALMRSDGLLIADRGRVTALDGAPERRVLLPLADFARGAAGRGGPANIAALGAFAAVSGLVPFDVLADTIARRVPRGTETTNRRAFQASYDAARAAAASEQPRC